MDFKFSYSSLLLLVFLLLINCAGEQQAADDESKQWALVLHGGAGTISEDVPDSVKQRYYSELEEAVAIGRDILEEGGSSVDAVEKVINYLEDNPQFNAGKGAVYTHEERHELDAAFMDGSTRDAGAVTSVTTVKNPISLARKVMEESEHVMFAKEGAENFAGQVGVERVENSYFNTESRYEALQRALEEEENSQSYLSEEYLKSLKYGTVGCVALDQDGNIVAGTSTGGMTNKKFGRVGDVPIIGSGTYADELVGVSMTGWGEKIMRNVSGHTVAGYMRFKEAPLNEAGDYLLFDVLDEGDAGMIAVDNNGNIYMNMNTEGMYRGAATSEGLEEVEIWQ